MRTVAKPIEMLAWFEDDGTPYPVKFKITNKDQTESTIKIDSIKSSHRKSWHGTECLYIYAREKLVGSSGSLRLNLSSAAANGFFLKYNNLGQ